MLSNSRFTGLLLGLVIPMLSVAQINLKENLQNSCLSYLETQISVGKLLQTDINSYNFQLNSYYKDYPLYKNGRLYKEKMNGGLKPFNTEFSSLLSSLQEQHRQIIEVCQTYNFATKDSLLQLMAKNQKILEQIDKLIFKLKEHVIQDQYLDDPHLEVAFAYMQQLETAYFDLNIERTRLYQLIVFTNTSHGLRAPKELQVFRAAQSTVLAIRELLYNWNQKAKNRIVVEQANIQEEHNTFLQKLENSELSVQQKYTQLSLQASMVLAALRRYLDDTSDYPPLGKELHHLNEELLPLYNGKSGLVGIYNKCIAGSGRIKLMDISPAVKIIIPETRAMDADAGIAMEDAKPCHLLWLIDISGSMEDPAKLPYLKEMLEVTASRLRETDKLSILTFAGHSKVWLSNHILTSTYAVQQNLTKLKCEGESKALTGIELAFEEAKKEDSENINTRIMLFTDGGFEIDRELLFNLEKERYHGYPLSIIMLGRQNQQMKERLKNLATEAGGNFYYLSEKDDWRYILKEAGAQIIP